MGLIRSIITADTAHRMRKREQSIYEAIKEQPDLAPKSKKLATRSITFSILSLLMVVIAIGIAFAFTSNLLSEKFFLMFLIAILGGIVCVVLFIVFYIKSITSLVYQFKLNKTPITWTALAFCIVPTIIFVVGLLIVIINAAKNGNAA